MKGNRTLWGHWRACSYCARMFFESPSQFNANALAWALDVFNAAWMLSPLSDMVHFLAQVRASP